MPRHNPAAVAEESMYVEFPDGKKYYARPLTKDEDAIVGIKKAIIVLTNGARMLVNYGREYKPAVTTTVTPFKKPAKKGKKKGKK